MIMKWFVRFSLLVLMVHAVSGCGVAPQRLRVISYNILEGFETDKTMPNGMMRKKAVSDWLYEQQPDIVGFQELNGYSEEKLQREAAQWGHAYAATNKTGGYIVGITSRYPIDVIEKRVEGMHHGLIHVRTNGIDVIATHFSPFQWSVRNNEAAIVVEKVKTCLHNNQPVIVMGDLNANSPQDADLVTEDYLRHRKASDDRHDHVQNLEDGKVSFTCLQTLLECGLLDVYVPFKEDSQAGRRMRIDYILASQDLAKTVQKASWLVQPKFKDYSDHYPVVADFADLN
jgi:exodeoxyribonuclease-3